jgi:TetR/AcrR family transcriptional regulator, mexCD-oprJ operon repressor
MAMAQPAADRRRATAERNVEAILDAAGRLLEERRDASIAAVAAAAGVSRVTVYAHFPTREALLEAVVKRTVRHATATLEAAEPDAGDPVEALERIVAAGWSELERNEAIARAASAEIASDARLRAHETAFRPVRRLVERGQRDGAFRTDLPVDWLVAVLFALMHAAADEVRAGRLDPADAPRALGASLRAAFIGGR